LNFKINVVNTNNKDGRYEKIMSVKLLAIVIIVSKRYPSSYCLMQGKNWKYTSKLESQPFIAVVDVWWALCHLNNCYMLWPLSFCHYG